MAPWLTVTVCPAIVSVPVRAPPEFAAIATPTVPLPVPLAPEVTVMNASLLAAVHAHALPVVTVIVAVLAAAPALMLVGDRVNVQTTGVRNVSVLEYALVIVPLVARACQKYS